ncbi:MAG: RecQ family ATP-dependent DNA helicase [Verrucomicrobia bacterium]|nr:RecQ family ATP-dependent DNA helicase [Verrucomicrobiota bacterium]
MGDMMTMKAPDAKTILADVFGFETFKPGQGEIIDLLMQDKSALAVFPTGGGKSLCYQLPALMFEGMTLVVSPLIALMKDQIDVLVSRGIRAARLDSSLSVEASRAVWDELWKGNLKLLYVAPERFASERFLQRLRQTRISLMVIDEAHCISEWGHNFRPDYLKLAGIARQLQVERVLALTATATPAVATDIQNVFKMDDDAYVNTGFHRPNLVMSCAPCTRRARDKTLLTRIQERPRGATIVYVTLQRTAEEVAAYLRSQELPARAYHAGLEPDERSQTQEWFMESEEGIVVATIAFGMGIDKANIRYVYHYNMPKSLENYMQETGRAGRDGAASHCDMLVCPDDISTLENFIYGDTPTLEAVAALLDDVLGMGDRIAVSVYALSVEHDIRQLVVSTILTYLEMEGVLVSTGPFYDEYKFQPLRPSEQMLTGFDEDRTRFLRRLFALATQARKWYTIDMSSAAAIMGEPRERLVAALNYFEERGDIVLKVEGLMRGYKRGESKVTMRALASSLDERFRRAEQRDVARINQVVELATLEDCTVRHVLSYFGEALSTDCGHCDRCSGADIPLMPARRNTRATVEDREQVAELVAENHAVLRTPRQLARFLCGLSSPATSRARMMRDPRFGVLSHVSFQSVLDLAERSLLVVA